MPHILIIEDDLDIRELISTQLEQNGFHVVQARSGNEAIKKLSSYPFELIILDLMMNDGNGFDVLHYLHEINSPILVIVISAKGETQDTIHTLGLGADDYIKKPFSPLELVARVQALLRRNNRTKAINSTAEIKLNQFILDIDNQTLKHNNKQSSLTEIECELFHLFMTNPDRILTRKQIYQHIWKHEYVDNNTLNVYINRIRTILNDTTVDEMNYLQTVHGIGYRFSGDGR